MKLDANTISYINDVVRTAQLIGCEDVMIEPGRVRGMDEAQTVVMLQTENVPDMPFGSIGLNRLSVFQSRYDIARVQDGFYIDADSDTAKVKLEDDSLVEQEFARSLTNRLLSRIFFTYNKIWLGFNGFMR